MRPLLGSRRASDSHSYLDLFRLVVAKSDGGSSTLVAYLMNNTALGVAFSVWPGTNSTRTAWPHVFKFGGLRKPVSVCVPLCGPLCGSYDTRHPKAKTAWPHLKLCVLHVLLRLVSDTEMIQDSMVESHRHNTQVLI